MFVKYPTGMRDSHPMSAQVPSDSELVPGDDSLAENDYSRPIGVRFPAPSDSAGQASLTHTSSSSTYAAHEVSSSSEDVTPHRVQPFPSSPPHLLRPWGTTDYDSLSVTPTPGPQTILHPSCTAEEDSPTKATQTQPVRLQLPRSVTCVLSQPDLSVSDTASTFSTAREGGRESDRGRRSVGKELSRSHSASTFSTAREGGGESDGRGQTATAEESDGGSGSDGKEGNHSPSASAYSTAREGGEESGGGRRSEEKGLTHSHSAIAQDNGGRGSDGKDRESGWAKPPHAPKPPKPKRKTIGLTEFHTLAMSLLLSNTPVT